MSDVAISVSLLALVAVVGLWLGSFEFKGVGLGIGGVLFGGIFVGHFVHQQGIALDLHTLHFVQEFGLILFVYSIGIQVGPGFFSSLRSSGLRLNGFAALLVLLGGLVAAGLNRFMDVPLAVVLGIFSGAVTNTPSLGAGQQILTELGASAQSVSGMGMAYAMAYPFGICGILLSMWLLRLLFRINVNQEAQAFETQAGRSRASLATMNVALRNTNLNGLALSDVPLLADGKVICSRLKRGETLSVPRPQTSLEIGDILHLVGDMEALRQVQLVIGEAVETSLSTHGTELRVERVVVTNVKVIGKNLVELALTQTYDVVISRLNRAGVELVPEPSTTLQFGDILNLVGRPDSIEVVAGMMGNAQQKLQQVHMLPVFIGIGLGVLLGSIPFYLPGIPAALKLGLAGGPLVVALVVSRIGSIGTLHWFMPPSANLALRELGIVLFLAVVGLKSGGQFLATLMQGPGVSWLVYGAMITLLPLLTVGLLARIFGKTNYLTLCGLLAGSMTDPPALAFANAMHPTSGAAALSYVTVYPLVMFLRIVAPQLLALMLWVPG
ncbi:MAG: putative transporter [Rhodoferax sp.]|jgi:putative transport protein|uniref:putative transporter n=1 Tax=Rhodoferax sp. TaxID=50421 RepID=UPI001B3D65BF|nr:putative transporter [Rhodoferax sp.]MBP8286599.1 putative transporter [Rhodoferax sp.]MBP9149192.1 putative transporter [Rhodoferax sp.]MBP9735387.1 putative transporter [Rhodoferax sp.]